MAELWRKRRFRFLLNLIDHLPRDSAYAEAVAQDDELAEQNREHISAGGERKPPVSEFGASEELLAGIHDVLGVLNANLLAVNGNKPGKPRRWPRPETAADRLARRLSERGFLEIVSEFAPHDAGRFN